MNFFPTPRQSPIPESAPARLSIFDIILKGRLQVTEKRKVLDALSHWVGLSHTWQWQENSRNKGVEGYPAALIKGITYLDRMFCGCGFVDNPLYAVYDGRRWSPSDVKKSMTQLNIAAHDYNYQPADPARKKHLQRLSLSAYFWNGYLKGEPRPYTHAPFIFFYENGAILNENSVEKKKADNTYLLDMLFKEYTKMNGFEGFIPASNAEYNRFVHMSNGLSNWWADNASKIPQRNRNIDMIVAELHKHFTSWKKPLSTFIYTSNRTVGEITAQLSKIATHIEYTEKKEIRVHTEQISPTDILADIPSANVLTTLCVYGQQQNVSVDPTTIDQNMLCDYSHFTLRQVLRYYLKGVFNKVVSAAPTATWQDILKGGSNGYSQRL